MYLKLAFRNAKRSAGNYLLYMTSMTILTAVMMVSNCLAAAGKIQAGFQTASLPVLIVIIAVMLTGYINRFMLKQRAVELSCYLLMGMEKKRLSWLFVLEFSMIGMGCCIVGGLTGTGIYAVLSSLFPVSGGSRMTKEPSLLLLGFLQTFFWFCLAQLLTFLHIRRNMERLQIRELMTEEKRSRNPGGKRKPLFWGRLFCISLICLTGMLFGITFLPAGIASILISVIALPLLLCVFAFYKWLFLFLCAKRQAGNQFLYRGNSLYITAQLTAAPAAGAVMNGICCVSLIFSAASFVTGMIMLQAKSAFYEAKTQEWMGFLQICICILFTVIYFSVLTLQQMIELAQEVKNIRLLYFLGKTQTQLKAMVTGRIALKLSLPAVMCIVPLASAVPLLNFRLNQVLPVRLQNILVQDTACFLFCFLFLFVCYFLVACAGGRRYVENAAEMEH